MDFPSKFALVVANVGLLLRTAQDGLHTALWVIFHPRWIRNCPNWITFLNILCSAPELDYV